MGQFELPMFCYHYRPDERLFFFVWIIISLMLLHHMAHNIVQFYSTRKKMRKHSGGSNSKSLYGIILKHIPKQGHPYDMLKQKGLTVQIKDVFLKRNRFIILAVLLVSFGLFELVFGVKLLFNSLSHNPKFHMLDYYTINIILTQQMLAIASGTAAIICHFLSLNMARSIQRQVNDMILKNS